MASTEARDGAALITLPDRGLLAVTGPLRVKFLHGILSHDVQSLQPGQGRRAALMDARGRLLAFLRVLVDGDAVLLEVAGERLRLVEEQLVHYKVAAPVRFAGRATAVVALVGARAGEVLAAAGAPVDLPASEEHRMVTIAGQPVRVVRAGDMPAAGLVLHVDPEVAASVQDVLVGAGAVAIERAALDAMRIEDGRPWYGPDVTEENLLHETGLVAELHSPSKGCYIGQETIARLEARGGNVNKQLRGLRLFSPVSVGDVITSEAQPVGRVTTAAVSPELGPVAMGYVHRNAFQPGTTVEVDGAPAIVAALPMRRA